MLAKPVRGIFHKLLDYLGVELRLKSLKAGPPDKNDASNNGLYFYSKKSGKILLEKNAKTSYLDGWNLGDEENAARFLLEDCIEFIDPTGLTISECKNAIIKNPFFGCSSLEAAALKLDILTGGDGVVEDDGRELG